MDNRPGAVDDLTRLYRETIRQHAAHPIGYQQEIGATHQHEEYNPLCGDRIRVLLRINGDLVEAAAFEGEACAICMASASLMCEHTQDQSLIRLKQLHDWLHEALDGDAEPKKIGELNALLGVKPYPSRIRCATLPWTAAIRAVCTVKPNPGSESG